MDASPYPNHPNDAQALGSRFKPMGLQHKSSSLGEAIARATRLPETEALAPLIIAARLDADLAQRRDVLARQLVTGLRKGPSRGDRAGRVQSLMQQYRLSTDEGVALMCLAEALLRIPDAATRNALIRDKIGPGDWRQYLGQSDSLFVNAASWGLLLSGRLVATYDKSSLLGALTRLAGKSAEPLIGHAVQMAIQMLGEQFVTGETIDQALVRSREMQAAGFRYSYDMLGEAALTAGDAERYFQSYEKAIHAIGQASGGQGIVNGPGISIKLSALHPRYSRTQKMRVMDELLPRVLHLAQLARRYDIGLNIDAEESDRLELSLDILEALCHSPSLQSWQGIGFVIQAYQKRCPFVVDFVVDLARRSGHRLMIRLVKGAYWDSEIKRAQLDGQSDYPVYTRKHHTDISYLACARKLLAVADAVYPQFATHNAQTVASIVCMAEAHLGAYTPGQYEFQCLHGMGEPLYLQLVGTEKLNRPCRIYAPVGTHETLLAYLVRRLLENGANSSFVNRMADPEVSIDDLVKDPVKHLEQQESKKDKSPGEPHPHIPLPEDLYGIERRNSSGPDLAHEPTLDRLAQQMQQHVGALHTGPMTARPPLGAQVHTLRNPADYTDVLGTVQYASAVDVSTAISAATEQAPLWADVPPDRRAALLEHAAQLLEAETTRCMALLIREAGKTWSNAVAELREAVDFLRYYSAQVRRDFDNSTHKALGPVVCISPWNFPLAIFLGQIAAALAAGNTVLAKPAESTPAVAALAIEKLWQAGVPKAALQLLPGLGSEVGMQLILDDRIQGVLFTGSTETARLLQLALAQRLNAHGQVVPLIAETGGQNCMIVDSSALLEQVAQDAVASAFDAAGQRCSALRILCVQEDVAERLIDMLKGIMAEIRMDVPARLHTDMGPVIDARAHDAIEAHVAKMQAHGHPVHRICYPANETLTGTWVLPTLIEISRLSDLDREVFGPVLHVMRYARDELPQLLEAINATGYALTLGVHSRIEESIRQVVLRSHAGNVYVNRNMVGAVVGVQPFGGAGLSGTGPKAGGPLYLLRLLAQCPEDAALRSVLASGAAAIPQPQPPLKSLYEWAITQDRLPLAEACARFTATSAAGLEVVLNGPTGEQNIYRVQARNRTLCLTGDQPSAEEDRLTQLAAVLAVGSRALWHSSLESLANSLPLKVRSCIDIVSDPFSEPFEVALIHGEKLFCQQIADDIARRQGPIVTIVALRSGDRFVPLARLVTERSISTNTAAAGGNASLMILEGA
jgi:RHH-type proline utilization regulon transcriptional repressor/proline dehydrogenase/delta 1-pyrroline-5-carboxylate dehydrogenase